MERPLFSASARRFFGRIALASLLTTSLSAQANFSGFYTEDEVGLAAFEGGGVFTASGVSGFLLTGNSEVEGNSLIDPVPSLARFDDSGTLLWSVYLDAGADGVDTDLIADPQDTSKGFAGYVEALGSGLAARVGLFNGADRSAVFAKQIPLQADESMDVDVNYFPGNRSAVLQDLGSSVRLLALDASGNLEFDKSYASAEFSSGGFFTTQNAKVSAIADGSGFYISVLTSELNAASATPSYDSVFSLLNVDNAGALRWAKSFALNTGAAPIEVSYAIPGNGYLFTSNVFDPNTSTSSAYVVKFSSDGSLDFARTIEGVNLLGQIHDLSEASLNFSGTIMYPGDTPPTDAALINLDPNTGAIDAQIGIDQGVNDFGTLTGETGGKLFGTVLSSDNPDFANPTTTLFRFDSNLANPIAATYSGVDEAGMIGVKGSNELVFSPFNATGGSIGAFTLNADLVPSPTPECVEFTSTTLNTFDPGLSADDLSLSPTDLAVDVSEETTTLNDSTLPLEELSLLFEPCAAEGELLISSQPASQTVEAGADVTFSVTATGAGELTYQWKKDNVELPGETASSLTLENVSESDAGTYVVVVSNADGSVTSDPATLTVEAEQNAGFAAYLDSLQVPAEQRGFGDDPDLDAIPSGLEYLMGSDAGDASSRPQVNQSIVMVEGQAYLAVSFPRDTAIGDLSLTVQFSSSLDFASVLDAVEISTEDLGGGIERVSLRSSVAIGAESQFARIFGGAAE